MKALSLVVVAALALTGCKEKARPVAEAPVEMPKAPAVKELPDLPLDVVGPSKGVDPPPSGTCIDAAAAQAVALLAGGRSLDCPNRLDRTMSGEKVWPRAFQSLGLVLLNEAGTQAARDRGDTDVCCYDVRKVDPRAATP